MRFEDKTHVGQNEILIYGGLNKETKSIRGMCDKKLMRKIISKKRFF